jgi:hypothetical protein
MRPPRSLPVRTLQAAPDQWPGSLPGTNSPLDCSCPGKAPRGGFCSGPAKPDPRRRLGLVAAALVFSAAAFGQPPTTTSWADPTRPPGALVADTAASAPRAPRPAATASSAAPAIPQLQSVQVGTDGRATALVDGRLLQAGDALGGSRVVAIDADGLTLRDAKGRSERLSLISSSIAKRDGGAEKPVAVATETRQAGRQGQRP